MFYIALIVLHIIVCIILISVILLQAGRGGGLTDSAGGGELAQSVLGTQAPIVLKKATSISAILFIVTSLLLGIITAGRGRSLLDGKIPVTTIPVSSSQTAGQTPVEAPNAAPATVSVETPAAQSQEPPAPQETN